MWQVGVWEQEEGLAEAVTRLAGGQALVRACSHPAALVGVDLDLLVVSPGATGWAGAGALSCKTVLIPGGLASLARAFPSAAVMSYGSAPRNTLALSGLDGGRAAVAVQWEFSALDGRTVERQELVLPYAGGSPELLLATTGAALLLGKLRVQE